MPELVEADDKISDILINGDIAWVFFGKKILKWSIGGAKWVKEDSDEQKPIWSISNNENIVRIVM